MAKVFLAAGASNVGSSLALYSQLPAAFKGDVLTKVSAMTHTYSWSAETMPPGAGAGYGPNFGASLFMPDGSKTLRHSASSTSLAVDWWPSGAPGTPATQTRTIFLGGISGGDQVVGLWFQQGSGDSHDPAHAAAYQANLTGLIGYFRTQLGLPSMPVVISYLDVPAAGPYGPDIWDAQRAFVAADANATAVRHYSRLRMKADGLHVRGEQDGMFSLGLAAYAALEAMQ